MVPFPGPVFVRKYRPALQHWLTQKVGTLFDPPVKFTIRYEVSLFSLAQGRALFPFLFASFSSLSSRLSLLCLPSLLSLLFPLSPFSLSLSSLALRWLSSLTLILLSSLISLSSLPLFHSPCSFLLLPLAALCSPLSPLLSLSSCSLSQKYIHD